MLLDSLNCLHALSDARQHAYSIPSPPQCIRHFLRIPQTYQLEDIEEEEAEERAADQQPASAVRAAAAGDASGSPSLLRSTAQGGSQNLAASLTAGLQSATEMAEFVRQPMEQQTAAVPAPPASPLPPGPQSPPTVAAETAPANLVDTMKVAEEPAQGGPGLVQRLMLLIRGPPQS